MLLGVFLLAPADVISQYQNRRRVELIPAAIRSTLTLTQWRESSCALNSQSLGRPKAIPKLNLAALDTPRNQTPRNQTPRHQTPRSRTPSGQTPREQAARQASEAWRATFHQGYRTSSMTFMSDIYFEEIERQACVRGPQTTQRLCTVSAPPVVQTPTPSPTPPFAGCRNLCAVWDPSSIPAAQHATPVAPRRRLRPVDIGRQGATAHEPSKTMRQRATAHEPSKPMRQGATAHDPSECVRLSFTRCRAFRA